MRISSITCTRVLDKEHASLRLRGNQIKILNLLYLYLHLRVAYRPQDIYDNFVCANRGSKLKEIKIKKFSAILFNQY